MPKGIKGFQKGNKFGYYKKTNRRSYFGKNNPHYGKTHTKAVKEKLRLLHLNEGNPNWKGNNVGYSAIHYWVKKRIPKPEFCIKCGIKKATDLSNTGHTYKRNLLDWEWLCRKCHVFKDEGWGYYKINKK
jgi:hypothetical protein